MSKRFIRYIHFFGLILFVYLLVKIKPANILGTIREADILLFTLSFVLFIPIGLLQTLRWKLFLKLSGIHIKFFKTFQLYLYGQFYGVITPGKIGSFTRIFLLKDVTDSALFNRIVSVVLDRISDIVSMLFLVCGGALFLSSKDPRFLYPSAILIFFGILFLLAAPILHRNEKPLRFVYRIIVPASLSERFTVNDLVHAFRKSHRLLFPFCLGLAGWMLIFFQGYVVGSSIGLSMGVIEYVFVAPIASIIGLIPITVSGFGTRDAVFISLMSLYGFPPERGLTLSLLAYFVNAIFPSLLGMFLIFFNLVQSIGWKQFRKNPFPRPQ